MLDSKGEDSILRISFKDSVVLLDPKQVFRDTIITIIKHNGNTMEKTSIVYIENCGLVLLENIYGNKNKEQEEKRLGLDVLNFAEQMPEFVGGEEALLRYLYNEIDFSKHNTEDVSKSIIYIEFIVAGKGEISNVKILRGINESLNSEVLNVFENMPNWVPGENNGKPIPVKMVFPIRIEFKL